MQRKNDFGTKYPIVSMPMNKVSDLKLAIAVRHAGALPSLSIYNYADLDLLEQDIIEYKKEFNDAKLLLSIGTVELRRKAVCNLIIRHQIEIVEVIQKTLGETGEQSLQFTEKESTLLNARFLKPKPDHELFEFEKQHLELIRSNNVKVFLKTPDIKGINHIVDGLVLKGNEGAGRGIQSLETLFADVKKENITLPVIVSGGIGTAEQVKHYLDNDASAVGIGTLLAVSKESKISHDTKLRMIESTASDIKKFTSGATQNALIFTEVVGDTFNHTKGLEQGIAGPDSGHIFVGRGIDYIDDIKSVSDIINDLVKLI